MPAVTEMESRIVPNIYDEDMFEVNRHVHAAYKKLMAQARTVGIVQG